MIYCVNGQEIISESSSKGNQKKFFIDSKWVKVDNTYEGLAENFVSYFENCIYDFPFVFYNNDFIDYGGDVVTGCYSFNMYDEYTSFVSLRKLLRDSGYSAKVFLDGEIEDCIKNVIEIVGKITGLDLLGYFGRLFLIDSLIVNEDRHWMNLGVCYSKLDGYKVAPCFDNGCSLFCSNWYYKPKKDWSWNMNNIKSVAKPFSKFYDKQTKAVLDLGVQPLLIDYNKYNYLLNNYYNNFYSLEQNRIIKRCLSDRIEYNKSRGVFKFV